MALDRKDRVESGVAHCPRVLTLREMSETESVELQRDFVIADDHPEL